MHRDASASPFGWTFYDASEDEKHMERDANAAMARSSTRSGEEQAIRAAGKASRKAGISRKALNAQAESIEQVSVLQGSFQYYSVGGFPIAVNTDNWEKQRFALVPNPVSGLWETDNRFEGLIRHDIANDISVKEAELLAEALVQSDEIRRSLKMG